MTRSRKIGVMTNGQLVSLKAKMAHGALRYLDDVAVIVDKDHSGQSSAKLLPYIRKDVPIVDSIEAALKHGITEILLGISPPGGKMDGEWESLIDTCMLHNIKVISGLHLKFGEMQKYKYHVERGKIVDLRYQYSTSDIFKGDINNVRSNVVMTVGTDCGAGKMTTALEVYNALLREGITADFIPTGQTGMYIKENGFAIDALVSDFMAGAIENFVCKSDAKCNDFIFVEGQGSITHPAYSGVTLGLLHGAAPNILILCHDISRKRYKYFEGKIPSISEQIKLYEQLASYQRECRVLGISVFAGNLSGNALMHVIDDMESEYNIPVFAPLEHGVHKMVKILKEFQSIV